MSREDRHCPDFLALLQALYKHIDKYFFYTNATNNRFFFVYRPRLLTLYYILNQIRLRTQYPIYNRVGKGNPVLRHSVSTFRILEVLRVEWQNSTSTQEQRNGNIN